MPRETIVQILVRRDGITKQEAQNLWNEARDAFYDCIDNDESPDDICEEYFGLEPDYLDEFF